MIRSWLRRIHRFAVPFLFARRNYKLLLRTSLEDVEERTLALATATDYFAGFVRSIPIRAPFGKSILVVAPHQDDEAIGCGGALALQVRSGGSAAIVILTDGGGEEESLGLTREAMTELRNEESRRCAATLGIDPPVFLNHARLGEAVPQAAAELLAIVRRRRIDAVFVPFLLDSHPDHRAANRIVASALAQITWDVRVLGYEVWGLCVPNVLVVIDDVIDEKLRMIACFEFANKAIDYVASTRGLNMFHSRMLGAGECRYAERFFELPRREYVELVERMYGPSPITTPVDEGSGRS